MRVNLYALIERALEEGARGGIFKAHKYSDNPSEEELIERIVEYQRLAIDELFTFSDADLGVCEVVVTKKRRSRKK